MTAYRLFDRLPLATTVILCRTYPDGMASIVRDLPALPPGEAARAWDWERPAEIAKIMRTPPVGPERRTG